MKRIIVIISLFIFIPVLGYCADYYCDFEGSNGSGTQDSPFNSITYAMGSMSAGDSLYCRGTTISNQTCSKGVNIYGNDASWLAYGGGNNRATLTSNASGYLLHITATDVLIDGLIINDSYGYAVYADGSIGDVSNLEFRNNSVTNSGSWGMAIANGSRNISGISVHDNTFDTSGLNVPGDGYLCYVSYNDANYVISGLVFYNNIFKNAGEHSLRLTGTDISVYGNYFYDWSLTGQIPESQPHCAILLEVHPDTSSDNIYIYNNIIHGGSATGDGSGIQFYVNSGGSIGEVYIQNNSFYLTTVYSSGGWAIENAGWSGTKWVIKNNIFYNCGADETNGGVASIKIIWSNESSVYLYNNIIHHSSYTDIIKLSGRSPEWVTVAEAQAAMTNAGNNAAVVPGWADTTPEDDVDDFKLSSSTANGAAGSSYLGDNCYSASREKGPNEYLYPDDYQGNTRQTSGNWDLGAIRYLPDATLPNPPTGLRIE